MIVGLKGIIEKKEPTKLHIDVNGIVYEVFVSLTCSGAITDSKIKLFTTHIIREDSQSLYGFLDVNEKKLFDTLIKINGVGPKVALAICSTFSPSSFAQILITKDVNLLKTVPGIGPKGASRILVELSGMSLDIQGSENSIIDNSKNEASLALESLGFKKDIITKVLSTCSSVTTSDLVREALKKLQK
ncbi:Holliday junction branch migration protein RuvA [Arcobacter sp. FWKO B]|uniref:Holliday junction branch migration protein RuvA n=1 Tax=Arcobacter sp. FWKO B TaxID=2593672 RepID=UPI0018A418F3|nr:Holliday junction branch migration protein RuvA [Arcobacter sp. FWKO B]QOG11531.1 Holliday junction branch migration protein RuvA [Arcobacter sp. FWKO B]